MDKAELFVELGFEEIPAWMLADAAAQFDRALQDALREHRLDFSPGRVWYTPRRIIVAFGDIPLRQEDLDELARTFTTYHYPINSSAFGGESDKDGNGVVIILMTDAVNALTPDCTDGRILGFFWGGDLLTVTGSNSAEVFYAMVPVPRPPPVLQRRGSR